MSEALVKVLVVDDYGYNRLVYGDSLREIGGVEVVEAATGRRALELAREHDFAMFLLDINMPDMDGFELASLLRQEPRAESTPIVFVTSEANERTYVLRGYRMGAADLMVSAPMHGEVLAQKARVFVQMFRKRQELQELVERAHRQNRELEQRLEKFLLEHEALRAQATHDPLTQLPNRTLFQDRLHAAFARAGRNRQRLALAYVDLDGFKAINDRYGHAVGDEVIVIVAQRLTRSLRASDTVARLGGDEFALLFEGLESPAGAAYVTEKIHRALTAPMTVRSEADQSEVEIAVGASIGTAIYPDHAKEIDELVVLADVTMYAVKRAGGGASVYPGQVGDGPVPPSPPAGTRLLDPCRPAAGPGPETSGP